MVEVDPTPKPPPIVVNTTVWFCMARNCNWHYTFTDSNTPGSHLQSQVGWLKSQLVQHWDTYHLGDEPQFQSVSGAQVTQW